MAFGVYIAKKSITANERLQLIGLLALARVHNNMPNDQTVAELVRPAIAESYKTGKLMLTAGQS